jgi:predicted HAD superfamily Cof-like phosphohydrolase
MDECQLLKLWEQAAKTDAVFYGVPNEVLEKFAELILKNQSSFVDVQQFQLKFGHIVNYKPVHLTKRKLLERIKFLQEELDEFTESCGISVITSIEGVRQYEIDERNQDLPLQSDALVDLTYVALGTGVMMGLPWQELWDDVHRANMEKVRGIGTRGNLVDCIKPEGWQGPKTLEILLAAGYDPQHQTNIEEHKDDAEHVQKIDNI